MDKSMYKVTWTNKKETGKRKGKGPHKLMKTWFKYRLFRVTYSSVMDKVSRITSVE